MTSVLGIHMSLSDSPGAVISTLTNKRDVTIGDFAWHLPVTASVGNMYIFGNKEAAGDVTWYHYAQVLDVYNSADDGWLHIIRDAAGLEILKIDLVAGLFRLTLTGSTTSNSSSIGIPITLTRWDIKIDMSGSGITATLYFDGSGTAALSVTVANSGTRGKPTVIVIGIKEGDDCYVSELYVADFDTRNTRPVKQVPDAVGNHTAWAGGESELGDEDSSTAASGASGGDKVSVNVSAYPGPASPAGINRVVLKVVGSRGATGPTNIKPFLRISTTDYPGANIDPTEAPLIYFNEWALNPATAAEWTTAALDTTEIGLEAIT